MHTVRGNKAGKTACAHRFRPATEKLSLSKIFVHVTLNDKDF